MKVSAGVYFVSVEPRRDVTLRNGDKACDNKNRICELNSSGETRFVTRSEVSHDANRLIDDQLISYYVYRYIHIIAQSSVVTRRGNKREGKRRFSSSNGRIYSDMTGTRKSINRISDFATELLRPTFRGFLEPN